MSNCQEHSTSTITTLCLEGGCTQRFGCEECLQTAHQDHDIYTFDEISDIMSKIHLAEIFKDMDVKEKQVHYHFEVIKNLVVDKLEKQKMNLLQIIQPLNDYKVLWEKTISRNIQLLEESQIAKLSEIISIYSQKRRSYKLFSKEKSVNDFLLEQRTRILNEFSKLQQQITDQYKNFGQVQTSQKPGQEIERFKSPNLQVWEKFQKTRLDFEQLPAPLKSLQGAWDGKSYRLQNGDLYQGEILYAKPHGKGVYIKKEGDVYEGVFEWGDIKWGQHFWWEIQKKSVGFEYGNMMDWVLHGKGVLSSIDNYEGEFYQGSISGYGTYQYSEGHFYEGEWKNSERDGRGSFRDQSGETYNGSWRNNKKNGYGEYYYKNGDKYEGEFVDDCREGKGRMRYGNGNVYDGHWKQDLKHGEGVLTYKGGQKYEGMYENDARNGKGCFHYKNGEKYEGNWKDGKFNGYGIYYYKNGDKYEGESLNGRRHGQGQYIFNDGKKYVGQYANDQREGKGVFYFDDGSRQCTSTQSLSPKGRRAVPERKPHRDAQLL